MSRKKALDDIKNYLVEQDYEKAMGVLREGMDATHVVRQSKSSGERGVDYKEVIDHSTRLSSAKLVLEYGFGKAATRAEINITDDSRAMVTPAEIMARLASSGQDLAQIIDVYSESVKELPMEIEHDG